MEFETYDILFGKKLDSLKEELLAYKNEEDIWKLPGYLLDSIHEYIMPLVLFIHHYRGEDNLH